MADLLNATRASNKNFGNDSISVFGTAASPVATAGQPLFAPSTARSAARASYSSVRG